jgi:hypothetical protein
LCIEYENKGNGPVHKTYISHQSRAPRRHQTKTRSRHKGSKRRKGTSYVWNNKNLNGPICELKGQGHNKWEKGGLKVYATLKVNKSHNYWFAPVNRLLIKNNNDNCTKLTSIAIYHETFFLFTNSLFLCWLGELFYILSKAYIYGVRMDVSSTSLSF